MTRSLLVLLVLSGCSVLGTAAPGRPVVEVPDVLPPPMKQQAPPSLEETVERMETILADLKQLSPRERTVAAEAVDALVVVCPWTRASHQLALALHHDVMKVQSCVGGEGKEEWELLRRGLTAHVATLDLLEVDLPVPVVGDHLFGRAFGVAIDRSTLLADAPLEQTAVLLEALPSLTSDLPDDVLLAIDTARDRAAFVMGHEPAFDEQVRGWIRALQRLEVLVEDPHGRPRIRRMLQLLEGYRGGC